MSNQVVTGSLYQVSTEPKELYGFIFLKKNTAEDGFIINGEYKASAIKADISGKIVTCVGKFPITYSGVTGSYDVFLFENNLVAALIKDSERFCTLIQ